MRSFTLRLGSSLLIGSVLLLLVYSLLVSAAPARSIRARVNAPIRNDIITDTRWIELIRSDLPGPQSHRSASALPTLNLHLIDGLIAGRASSPALITIDVWRDAAPLLRATATPYPDDGNYFYVVLLGQNPLKPGDVISLTQGNASFTMTVPTLSARVDAPTDRVFGSAPVSRSVTTYLYSNATGIGPYTQTVEVDASGNYTSDYASTLDVRPRDSGYVVYSEAPGRTTYVRFVAPFLRAQAGGLEISGMATPLSWVYLTAVDAAGKPYRYWGTYSAADGSFGDPYLGYAGISLMPGALITATSAGQTFTMTVLTLTAQIDLANGVVEGDAPANQPIELVRFNGPLCCASNAFWNELPTEQTTVSATLAGHYSAPLALTCPNYGAAIVTASDGNQTYARFAVPYLSARLGAYSYWRPNLLTGQIGEVATPITIAIQGPSGYFKDVRSATAASDGYFYDYGTTGLTLDSGDVITVTTEHGVQAALKLPLLTGEIDPVTDIVSGTAPAGARLALTVYYYGSTMIAPPTLAPKSTPYNMSGGGGPPSTPYTVIVTATAQGQYLVNLHGIIDLNNSSYGEVSLITVEGHAVTRVLTLSRQEGCDYRPNTIYVGGNRVDFGVLPAGCKPAAYGIVRLRDAAGHVKAQQDLPVWSYYYTTIYFYAGGYPVAIMPGDRLEVESAATTGGPTPAPIITVVPVPTYTPYAVRATDNHLITIDMPTLTVQLDPAANTLRGQAPANSTIALNVYRQSYYLRFDLVSTFTTTVDAQGYYTATVPDGVKLTAGNLAQVSYKPIEPPTFSATGVLPLLRTELYQSSVSGLLPPLSIYTATLQNSPSATLSYQGIASNEGDFKLWLNLIKPGDILTVTTAQQTLHLKVPTLTAHIDRATATIFGQAPPFAHLQVAPYDSYGYSQNVTATASGAYSATFPSLAPLNTTYGRLTYWDAAGNQVDLAFATVHWDVVVNDPCLNGIVDMAGAPLTLTLRSGNGTLKNTQVFTPAYPSYKTCFTTAVQSNDRLALQSAAATKVFTVPLLTAQHNYARQAVEGSAPPNEPVYAELNSAYNTRRVFADSDGRYGVDTSDLRLPLFSRGRVYVQDASGNSTSIYYTVMGYPTFLPLVRR